MVLTYIAALLFIALVLFVVVPEVADTVGKVKELLPGFVNRAKELALAYTKNVPAISEKIAGIEPDFDQIFSFFNDNGGEIGDGFYLLIYHWNHHKYIYRDYFFRIYSGTEREARQADEACHLCVVQGKDGR